MPPFTAAPACYASFLGIDSGIRGSKNSSETKSTEERERERELVTEMQRGTERDGEREGAPNTGARVSRGCGGSQARRRSRSRRRERERESELACEASSQQLFVPRPPKQLHKRTDMRKQCTPYIITQHRYMHLYVRIEQLHAEGIAVCKRGGEGGTTLWQLHQLSGRTCIHRQKMKYI